MIHDSWKFRENIIFYHIHLPPLLIHVLISGRFVGGPNSFALSQSSISTSLRRYYHPQVLYVIFLSSSEPRVQYMIFQRSYEPHVCYVISHPQPLWWDLMIPKSFMWLSCHLLSLVSSIWFSSEYIFGKGQDKMRNYKKLQKQCHPDKCKKTNTNEECVFASNKLSNCMHEKY